QPAAPTITSTVRPAITPMFAPTITRLPLPGASIGAPAAADERAVARHQLGRMPVLQEQPAAPAVSMSAHATALAAAYPSAPSAGLLPPLAATMLRRQALPAPFQQPATPTLLRMRHSPTPSINDLAESVATNMAALPAVGDWANVEMGGFDRSIVRSGSIA